MNGIKKITASVFAVVLAMAITFGSTTMAFAIEDTIVDSGTCGEVNWNYYDTGELYFYGKGELIKTNTSSVAWAKYIPDIEEVTIGKNVSYSEVEIFNRDGAGTYSGYISLKSITVEEGNTSFCTDDKGVLYNSEKTTLFLYPAAKSAEEYIIPNGVGTVAPHAFNGATVKKIKMSDSVRTIGKRAFYECAVLEKITLSENLTRIGEYAFFKCVELGEIKIHDQIKAINEYTFGRCYKLRKVELPETIDTIYSSAFRDCSMLNGINLPESILHINGDAFCGCSALTKITLPKNLKTIGDGAFQRCGITKLEIPESVTTIYSKAFKECLKLEEVKIPEKVTTINDSLFEGCTALKTVDFGNSVKTIGDFVFRNCINLEKVEIPDTVTYMNQNVFSGCTSLKEIIVDENNVNYSSDSDGVLYNKDKSILMKYPIGKDDDTYVIGDSVVEISYTAFEGATNLCNITIPSGIQKIGADAFTETGLYKDERNWGNGFLYIGSNLIDTKETKLARNCVLYDYSTLIASEAFEGRDIRSITMPDSVRYINSSAFENCSKLEKVYLSENLQSIENSVFSKCSALTEVKIPPEVKSIGNNAFANCTNLQTVEVNEKVETIGLTAFKNTEKLKELYLPESLAECDEKAFSNTYLSDIYYGGNMAQWKAIKGENVSSSVVIHYTMKSEDETVIIHHREDDFEWGSGNVHLKAEKLDQASPQYKRGDYYNTNLLEPIQVVNIYIESDSNSGNKHLQPIEGRTITVKIKASDEFMEYLSFGLNQVGDYSDVAPADIGYKDGTFLFNRNGKEETVAATNEFLMSFKVVHWFTDGTTVKDRESFDHTELEIKDGYIIMQTSHFSDYAICTSEVNLEIENGSSYVLPVMAEEGSSISFVSADNNIATVDEKGTVKAKNIGSTQIAVSVTKDEQIILTGKYSVTVLPREFTIIWNVDGEKTEVKVNEGAKIVKPENPAKDGYIFKGWTPEVPDIMASENKEFTAVFEEITVKKLKFDSTPSKLAYTYKIDALDLNGMILFAEMTDGSSEKVDINEVTVSGFDSRKTGAQTITVEYEGKTVEFEVTVERTWWQWLITIFLFGFIWY